LFQKTSAKFDEGGARGLLLNNLYVNAELNLMFDSGNVGIAAGRENNRRSSSKSTPMKMTLTPQTIKEIQGIKKEVEDALHYELCPELTAFKKVNISELKNVDFLSLQKAEYTSHADVNSALDLLLKHDSNMIPNGDEKEEFNQNSQPMETEPQAENGNVQNYNFEIDDTLRPDTHVTFMKSPVPGRNNNASEDTSRKELGINNIEERFAALGDGKSLNGLLAEQNWHGPENWKMNQKKKGKTAKAKESQEPVKEGKKKGKETEGVDFTMSNKKETIGSIFQFEPNAKKIKKNQEVKVKLEELVVKNTLPIDLHIQPFRLTHLFLRSINYTSIKEEKKIEIEQNPYDTNLEMINAPDGGHFDSQHVVENTQHTVLDEIFPSKHKEGQNERLEKIISIKALKENIWHLIEHKIAETKPNDPNAPDKMVLEKKKNRNIKKTKIAREEDHIDVDTIKFTEVCEDLTGGVLHVKQKGISVHSCFLTMLHLANEKNLKFAKDDEDFLIYKETGN